MIINFDPIASIQTSIGELNLFALSYKNYDTMMNDINNSIETCPPETFARHFVVYTCRPNFNKKDAETNSNEPDLSLDKVDQPPFLVPVKT